MKRLPALASFILFIALCASIAYWAMQLFKPPARPVTAPAPAPQTATNIDAAAGLFGGRSSVAVASNYQLRGVVMSGTAGESVAILATEGKPAQAIRANMEVAPGVKVQEVHRGYVVLSENGVPKRVELPQEIKNQAGADPAGRPPVPNRAVPNQQPSAADARRSAIFNQPSAPPAQASPPPVPSSPPPTESSMATVGSSGTAGTGNTGSMPAAGAAPAASPANGGAAVPAAQNSQPAAAQASMPSSVAPAAQQGAVQTPAATSSQQTTQTSPSAPQLAPQQR